MSSIELTQSFDSSLQLPQTAAELPPSPPNADRLDSSDKMVAREINQIPQTSLVNIANALQRIDNNLVDVKAILLEEREARRRDREERLQEREEDRRWRGEYRYEKENKRLWDIAREKNEIARNENIKICDPEAMLEPIYSRRNTIIENLPQTIREIREANDRVLTGVLEALAWDVSGMTVPQKQAQLRLFMGVNKHYI